MYFPKYGLGKPWLDKYLKNPFSEDLQKATWQTVPNTVQI